MKKKIFIIIFTLILSFSCGKKGDPIYTEENQNTMLSSAQHSTLA